MEHITIWVKACCIEVVDGRVKNSRLHYTAPNLHIYVKGAVPISKRDKVNYHVFELASARHIPLTQLRSQGWV